MLSGILNNCLIISFKKVYWCNTDNTKMVLYNRLYIYNFVIWIFYYPSKTQFIYETYFFPVIPGTRIG